MSETKVSFWVSLLAGEPAVIAPSRPPGRTTSRCPWRQGLSTSWTTSWARAKAWTSTPPHLEWAQRGDSLPASPHNHAAVPRARPFRTGWIRQLTRPETQQTCLRGSTQRRQKRTSAHKVVVLSVSSSSLCVTAPAPALHPNPYVQALHPPPLYPLSNSARHGPGPCPCHVWVGRTAEPAANRRPET